MKPALALLAVLALLVPAAKEAPPLAEPAVDANTAFACDLYAKLRAEEGNLFFSPYSISTAMAMARAGARGNTATEMDAALHTTGMPATARPALTEALRSPQVRDGYGRDARRVFAYELRIANTVWAQEELPIVKEFTDVLCYPFDSVLERIDFRDTEAARKAINDWVAKNTRDKITDIVPEGLPTPDTLLALANAIYYKAAWRHPFEERWTKEAPFTTAAGTETPVSLMHKVETYRYAETGDLQVLDLPYRADSSSMTILLPKAKDGLPSLEQKLTPEQLGAWLGALRPARVSVKIPKFETTWFADIGPVLKSLGMADAFTSGVADFTGMTKAAPLFIGPVLHKAWVKVDEAGTEAAAATVVMMRKGGREPGEPIEFVADHPFLFLVRHAKTGCVLFVGRVVDPTAD